MDKPAAQVNFKSDGVDPEVLSELKAGVAAAIHDLSGRPAGEVWDVFIHQAAQSEARYIRFIVNRRRLHPQMQLPKGVVEAVQQAQEHPVGPPPKLRDGVHDEVKRYLSAQRGF